MAAFILAAIETLSPEIKPLPQIEVSNSTKANCKKVPLSSHRNNSTVDNPVPSTPAGAVSTNIEDTNVPSSKMNDYLSEVVSIGDDGSETSKTETAIPEIMTTSAPTVLSGSAETAGSSPGEAGSDISSGNGGSCEAVVASPSSFTTVTSFSSECGDFVAADSQDEDSLSFCDNSSCGSSSSRFSELDDHELLLRK